MTRYWDCAVAGGGPAGAAAALVLARAARSVLLFDDSAAGADKPGESLPGAARPLLRHLGVLAGVERGPHLVSYGNVSSWGGEPRPTDFIADPNGPGWHLDRRRFDRELRECAAATGAALRSERLAAPAWDGDAWRLAAGGTEVRARWLIDATGRRALAAARRWATRTRDDTLVALYGIAATHPGTPDTRTWIESVPDGWWYTARLWDGRRAVALHVDAEQAKPLLRSPAAWDARLSETTHVRRVLGERTLSTPPRGLQASGGRLDAFRGPGWLAVGDAALTFDPLASQGIFFALYSGMRAGEAVGAALDGDGEAPLAYAARIESIRAAYLDQHRHFYGLERRWTDRSFWQRRQGPGDGAAV